MVNRLFLVLILFVGLAAPAWAAVPLGVNLSGRNYSPGQQWPVAASYDYFFRQKGMKIARLNLSWDLLQPRLGGPLNPVEVAGVSDMIKRVTSAGGLAIVEPHVSGRRSVGGMDRIIGEDPRVTSAQFADFCTRIGKQWGGLANVAFEPMNEPHEQKADVLVGVLNACFAAYRKTGAKGLVIVPSNDWGSYGWRPGQPNLVNMLKVVDPADNMAQDIHWYPDAWGAGQKPDVVDEKIAFAGLLTAQAWARTHGRKLFLGEFATPASPAGDAILHDLLTLLNANADVWIGATWWGAGGWWSHDYLYRLDPYGSRWDQANPDREGGTGKAVRWDKPLPDQPPMKVLSRFIGAVAAPAQPVVKLDRSRLGAITFDERFDRPLAWWSDERYPPAGKRWRTGFEHSRWPGMDSLKARFMGDELQAYVDPAFRGLGIDPYSTGKDGLVISAAPLPAQLKGALDGQTWTSGLISTAQAFQQVYGYFEAEIKVPGEAGGFPAFWLYTFDGASEIDVMEILTSAPGVLYNGALQRDTKGVLQGQARVPYAEAHPFPSLAGDFHRYGVLWTPEKITFYLDDVELWSIANPPPGVPDKPGWHEPMFMMVNLAIGGKWNTDKGFAPTGPMRMGVRHVRAYALS